MRAFARLSVVVVTKAEARVDVVTAAAAGTVVLVVVAVAAGTVVLVVAAADQRAYNVTSVSPVGVYVAPRAVPPVDEVNQPSNC